MPSVPAKPLYIRMHADDNVAIVANSGGLHRGAEFACGLRLIEQIPQGHKVALADIGEGETIRRYGEIIAKHSGKDVEQVMRDIDRDRFLEPHEAVEYGLADHVLRTRLEEIG